jgi:hypothetical protein
MPDSARQKMHCEVIWIDCASKKNVISTGCRKVVDFIPHMSGIKLTHRMGWPDGAK